MTKQPGLAALDLPLESLSGRRVLVTGGSRGIGRACAEQALSAGANVVIAARGNDALELTRTELSSRFGDAVHAWPGDVADERSVSVLVERATAAMGGLDGVIHAAAVLGPIGPTIDQAPAAWWDAVRINLFGTFAVVRAAAAVMPIGSRMVVLSGGGATRPFPNYSAYAASKAAVVRLTETLAEELAGRIEINALAPGFVRTAMHDATLAAGEMAGAAYLDRTKRELAAGGVPPELAGRAAVFLLSPRSAGITGRLVAAPWDEWWRWPDRLDELGASDVFTLRRIVPGDRGGSWQ